MTSVNVITAFKNFIKRIFFDVIVIFFAYCFQAFAIFFPVVLVSPLIILSDVLPELLPWSVIIQLIAGITWPILFLLGYLSALFIRAVFQTNTIKIFDGFYHRYFRILRKSTN
jgi:hypothetical protein